MGGGGRLCRGFNTGTWATGPYGPLDSVALFGFFASLAVVVLFGCAVGLPPDPRCFDTDLRSLRANHLADLEGAERWNVGRRLCLEGEVAFVDRRPRRIGVAAVLGDQTSVSLYRYSESDET